MDKFFKWLHDVSEKFGKAFGRFFEWLSRWLPRIKPIHVPNLSPATKAGKALVYTVYALGIAAVILLLGWVVSKLVTARHRQAPTSRGEADAHPGIKRKNEPTYWDRALKHAEELWQQGDQREALRTLQQACLVLLDARGVLRYDDSRANGEVLYELKRTGRATVHDALRPVFRCFDRSWYGFLEVSSDEFTRVLENSRQFRLAVVEEA